MGMSVVKGKGATCGYRVRIRVRVGVRVGHERGEGEGCHPGLGLG